MFMPTPVVVHSQMLFLVSKCCKSRTLQQDSRVAKGERKEREICEGEMKAVTSSCLLCCLLSLSLSLTSACTFYIVRIFRLHTVLYFFPVEHTHIYTHICVLH